MPLFKMIGGKTNKINTCQFKNEAELQKLIEDNLERLTGIKLLESQYPIPNGRMDTLGIDEDNIPVVIEYKWIKDSGAIIQGLFYLDWVKQNKRTVNLIAKEKLGSKAEVNWSTEPRLIIIAQSFNDKELSAINQMKPSVELKKYSYYGDLFNIENVNVIRQARTGGTKEVAGQGRKVKEYTLEGLLSKANPKVKIIFEKLREQILALSDEVREKVGRWYCDYRTNSTFASPNMQKDGLKIYIKMGEKKIADPKKITKPVPKSYGYGKLNVVFKINSIEQIDYGMNLIKQAYDYVT